MSERVRRTLIEAKVEMLSQSRLSITKTIALAPLRLMWPIDTRRRHWSSDKGLVPLKS